MREKPPWCNPLPTLAPSLSLPLFLRVETKTDGLPAATRPPRARKYDYAALRDPRITALPDAFVLHASSLLPFSRITRRTIYSGRSIRPSRLWSRIQTEGRMESVKDWFPVPPSTSTPAWYCGCAPAAVLPCFLIPPSFLVDRRVKFSVWWCLSWYKYETDARL